MSEHELILRGGNPALDFINTVHDWTVAEPDDYLEEFADAVRFGEMAGLLTRADTEHSRRRAPRQELARLIELRALLKRIFEARLSGQPPARTDLDALAADLAEAARATRLVAGARRRESLPAPMIREVLAEEAGDATLRLRIVDAAVSLLVSDAMARVKSCPSCGWFFLDVSKNRSRRWCSMDTCGAITKSRRYYHRTKAPGPPTRDEARRTGR
jgi:predicted RNA-binding Zn ribbon-like protein